MRAETMADLSECDPYPPRTSETEAQGGSATRKLPLTDRKNNLLAFALIDEADYEWASQWTWRRHSGGYAYRNLSERHRHRWIFLHRELLGLKPGDGLEGDHINRDRLDNRRINLRIVTPLTNSQNVSKPKRLGSSSTHRGVRWHKGKQKWEATVRANRRYVYLGSFETEEAAHQAAKNGRLTYLPGAVD